MSAPLLATLIGWSALAGGRDVQVGDVPAYEFHSAPRNSVCVRTLEDLRGAPALFEFWGPRCPGCVQSAVPQALELQETWGDELQVVFVEAQGAGEAEAARFALAQRWFGGRALWTSEAPFWPGGARLPAFVLLGNEGQVLLKGNPLTQSREIQRLVAAEVRARREAPANAPEPLRPAWRDLRRGRIGAAARALAQGSAALHADAVLAQRLGPAWDDLRRAIDGRFARAAALCEAGYLDEFDAQLDLLRRSAEGEPDVLRRLDELSIRGATPAAQRERAAARRLARLLSRYFDSGGEAAAAGDLVEFAADHAGTRAAARALDWAGLAVARPAVEARR